MPIGFTIYDFGLPILITFLTFLLPSHFFPAAVTLCICLVLFTRVNVYGVPPIFWNFSLPHHHSKGEKGKGGESLYLPL